MADANWTDDRETDGPAPRPRWRTAHVVAASLIGVSVAAVALLATTQGFAWISTLPDQFGASSAANGPREMRLASVGDPVGATHHLPVAGAIAVDSYWILGPNLAAGPRTFMLASVSSADDPERDARIARIIVDTMPVPSRNPLFAGRLPDADLKPAPLPQENPLGRNRRQLASLSPGDLPDVAPAPAARAPVPPPPASTSPAPRAPASAAEDVPLPTAGSGYALYDIEAQVVYMPNGERLEAHSGYGDAMDDIRKVALRMRGPTPPNVYSLRPREALFHGEETLRLTPVGGGKMYGRDGFLIHPFMMGPRGDSNGCISVKDHRKILAAYRRGEVTKMVVVARLPNSVRPNAANSLLSWLIPKSPSSATESP